MSLRIDNRNEKGVLVFTLSGRLTMDAETLLADRVRMAIDGGARRLLVDLSGIDYVDSHGLGQMVACHNLVAAINGKVRFAGVSAKLRRLLEMTHLPRVLNFDDDAKTSLVKLRSK